jgi:hypothetical protein
MAKIKWNELPLAKIPLNKIPIKKVGRLLDKLVPKKDARQGEKILSYIRIYSNLVTAYNLMNKQSYNRAFEHLKILKNLTKEASFRGEAHYIDNIRKIVLSILKKKKTIARRLNKYEASDPAHAKTNLLLAQNICILRILNIMI